MKIWLPNFCSPFFFFFFLATKYVFFFFFLTIKFAINSGLRRHRRRRRLIQRWQQWYQWQWRRRQNNNCSSKIELRCFFFVFLNSFNKSVTPPENFSQQLFFPSFFRCILLHFGFFFINSDKKALNNRLMNNMKVNSFFFSSFCVNHRFRLPFVCVN